MNGAIDYIEKMVRRGKGGYVVTPNVDHVVVGERDERLRSAYADASLSLADGMPLVWLSKIAGCPLPEKVSGSDLVRPLLRRAASSGFRVYFLGAAPGVGKRAADALREEMPSLNIAGIDAPPLGFEKRDETERETFDKMLVARPDIVLVALGSPKQEILMHEWNKRGATAVMLGIGASIDFLAGEVKRAPPWMSTIGAEWLFRLAQDPKRLAKRYLLQDPRFLGIALRMLRTPREKLLFGME
jgi:N-acetylglucosaminyldiphosphoundecaprenol N-acetyl-beta-D-mannosaminyltransferase